MKRKLCLVSVFAGLIGLVAVTADAYRGHLGDRHVSAMAPLEAVVGPKQRMLIRDLFRTDRTHLEVLHEQVAAARKALIAKLLSSDKKVDVTKEVGQLKRAHDALIDERVKLALKVRKIMSPQQLSEASRLWTKWQDLRAQEHALFEGAHNDAAKPGKQ